MANDGIRIWTDNTILNEGRHRKEIWLSQKQSNLSFYVLQLVLNFRDYIIAWIDRKK